MTLYRKLRDRQMMQPPQERSEVRFWLRYLWALITGSDREKS